MSHSTLDTLQMSLEDFPYKALNYVEDAAENWTKGIKLLLG